MGTPAAGAHAGERDEDEGNEDNDEGDEGDEDDNGAASDARAIPDGIAADDDA
ncbi:hypothetical protein [Burkholderia plantarii]|uniref:hypothetical protein n=1 Tax=Burkholderia plantarii TaxID=41899 RepID=UPI00272D6DAA|nr:hypothetical protein [Burkholderia plantarii]